MKLESDVFDRASAFVDAVKLELGNHPSYLRAFTSEEEPQSQRGSSESMLAERGVGPVSASTLPGGITETAHAYVHRRVGIGLQQAKSFDDRLASVADRFGTQQIGEGLISDESFGCMASRSTFVFMDS